MRTLKRKDIKAWKEKHLVMMGRFDPVTHLLLENMVLDHDHTKGYCRDIIDRNLNQYIGKLESNYKRFLGYRKEMPELPVILRRIADYLEKDYSNNLLHPGWADLQVRKFSRENKRFQDKVLDSRGILPGKTSKIRTKQLKDWYYENN